MRFQTTEVLRRVLFQDAVEKPIGLDYSLGAQYRPWLNDNVIITGGVSVFTPGSGFKQVLESRTLYSPFVVLTFTY